MIPKLIFISLLLFVCTVVGCGVTTHNVIAHRAMHWFLNDEFPEYTDIIKKHQDAFQNGAAFPDWGYSCVLNVLYPELHQASEHAHWPPFQRATAEYIRTTYPQPWDADTEKLVAFLFGFVSHDVADILWHDLPVTVYNTHQGFIQTMANVNYNGDYSTAHTEADVGGEFMCAYEIDISFILDEWYLPSDDLSKIYKAAGFNDATPEVIELCNTELYAEVHAIKELPSQLLYPHFAEQSTFLVEQFQGFWLGGLNDMAIWTTQCWMDVIDWVENGPSSSICLVQVNDSDVTAVNLHYSKVQERKNIQNALRPYTKSILKEISTEKTERGMTFRRNSSHVGANPQEIFPSVIEDSECISQIGTINSFSIVTDDEYSELGRSVTVADFNNDGLDDVVIGAPGFGSIGNPQTGAVYIIYGRNSTLGHQNIIVGQGHFENATSIFGRTVHGRFGSSVGRIDINLDGYMDLVVSTPGTEAQKLEYKGELDIFFGSAKGLSLYPNIRIVSKENYSNLGFSLVSGDVSGDGVPDLIIGSPFAHDLDLQSGQVWVFFSSKHRLNGQILTEDDANLILNGETGFSWFGYHTEVIPSDSNGNSFLLVSAPQFNNGSLTVGKLYCYNLNSVGAEGPNSAQMLPLSWSITGVDHQGSLGHSFAIGNPIGNSSTSTYIALALPTRQIDAGHFWNENKPQAGSVYLFPINNLAGDYTMDQITPYLTFESDEEFSRLGWSVEFSPIINADGSQNLLISEPYRNYDTLLAVDGDAGAAYFWQGGSRFPSGIIPNCKTSSTICVHSHVGKSLYGTSSKMLDFNGDGVVDVFLGGPRDRSIATNAGSASILLGAM